MAEYIITYIGIGGIERTYYTEAFDCFEARKEFEENNRFHYEIISVEEQK